MVVDCAEGYVEFVKYHEPQLRNIGLPEGAWRQVNLLLCIIFYYRFAYIRLIYDFSCFILEFSLFYHRFSSISLASGSLISAL